MGNRSGEVVRGPVQWRTRWHLSDACARARERRGDARGCVLCRRDHEGFAIRPLPGRAGHTACSADKVVINTPKFLHRARAERDYLLSTMD